MPKTDLILPEFEFKQDNKIESVHVLYVDDEIDLLRTTKQILEADFQFNVEIASSVNEALLSMEKNEFDVIVSDYQMPEKDGLAFLKDLRSNGNQISFILFTGKGREDVAVSALNLGADYYLNKIGGPETVYKELGHYIGQANSKNKTLKKLKESEEKYRKLFEESMDAIFLADPETAKLIDCNRAATELIGRPKSEIIGQHQSCLHPPEKLVDNVSPGFKKHQEGKLKTLHKNRVITKNGQIKDVLIKASEFKVNNKRVLQGTFRDISHHKKMENALRQEQEMLELFTADIGAGLVIISKDYSILWTNKLLRTIFGDLENKKCYSLFHGLESVCPDCGVKEIFETEKDHVIHRKVVTQSGERRWLEITVNPVRDDSGRVIAASELSLDITDRHEMELQLKESEEKYRTQFEEALDAIVVVDVKTGKIVDCNRALAKLVERPKSEIIGSHQRSLHPPEEIEGDFSRTFKEHLNDKDGRILEAHVVTKNGQLKNVAIKANSFELKGRRLIQGIFRDVTSLKKSEEMLRKSEENYRELINGMNDTAWVISIDDCSFIDVNDAAVAALGYSREELCSMKVFDIDDSLSEKDIVTLVRNMPKDEIQVFETEHTTKNGRRIPVEISSSLVTYNGKQAILSIARDITDRRKLLNALKENEERFKQVTENAIEWIWEVDANGLYIYSSPVVEKLLGYKPEELIGKKHFYDLFVPEERENLKKTAFSAFRERQPFREFINRNVHKNGNIVWMSTSGVPIVDGEDKLLGYRGADVDITSRKNAEDLMEKMMSKLESVIGKLHVVGKATRHDVRNKLAVISNNVYLAKHSLVKSQDPSGYLEAIESAIVQIEKIFDFARTYELIGVEEYSKIDVGKSIGEAVMLLSGLGEIELKNECIGLTVLADSQLRQLFYNLLENSVKYAENLTKIRIYFEEKSDCLNIFYEDDGIGIPENEKELIFKEGYGRGTGYGLYLISKICESYGWKIQETGVYGEGVQFTMTISK